MDKGGQVDSNTLVLLVAIVVTLLFLFRQQLQGLFRKKGDVILLTGKGLIYLDGDGGLGTVEDTFALAVLLNR